MKAHQLAYVFALVAVLAPTIGFSHGGEDHSHPEEPEQKHAAPPPAGREAPARLPDGSIFMPKASQNLLGIRTTKISVTDVGQTLELKGHVRADPSSGGQVQATQMGRILPPSAGLPSLGQTVKAGQVLAWLEPVVDSVERGNQEAQLAQIQGQLSQAERRVARYEQLEGSVPQKEIDAARAELQALRQQKRSLSGGLGARLPLKAPVTGAVSRVAVVAGQVVEARQPVFEIVDPRRLIVDALGYDPRLIGGTASYSGSTDSGERLNLELLGTGLELRDQALPIQLRIVPPSKPLVIGQPVNVYARLKDARRGIVVPSGALARGVAGDQIVWVHTSAERFVPKKVQARNLDADSAVVTEGLNGGERVVVQGASSLAQIR